MALSQSIGALLSNRVEVQTKTSNLTGMGEVETWTTTATRWCRIMGIGIGMEIFEMRYMQERSQATHTILFGGNLNFSIANTRFKQGTTYYIPLEPSFDPGGNLGKYTSIHVRIEKAENFIS